MTDNEPGPASSPWLDYFPYDEPNTNQKDAMPKIFEAIAAGSPVLLEGACGTGKTLTALAPALAWSSKNGKKVVIATSVKAQTEQFIIEARDICKKNDIKVTVLFGKSGLCPLMPTDFDGAACALLCQNTYEVVKNNKEAAGQTFLGKFDEVSEKVSAMMEEAKKFKTADGEEPSKKMSGAICPYLMSVLTNEEGMLSFSMWYREAVRHPRNSADKANSTYSKAVSMKMCPYEATKRNLFDADLVICNYEHLINKSIRNVLLKWMGGGSADDALSLEDVVLIFDEAHNIEEKARKHSTKYITLNTIRYALGEMAPQRDGGFIDGALANYRQNYGASETECIRMKDSADRLLRLLDGYAGKCIEKFNADNKNRQVYFGADPVECGKMLGIIEFISGRCDTPIQQIVDDVAALGRMMVQYKFNLYGPRGARSSMNSIAEFIEECLKWDGDPKYDLLNYMEKNTNGSLNPRVELFCCIPSDVTEMLMNETHSTILMSATLQPFHTIVESLGIKKKPLELEYGTPFPEERRLTLSTGSFELISANREKPEIQAETVRLIEEIVKGTPGNVMVVFPTGKEAKKYHALTSDICGVSSFVDISVNTDDVKASFFGTQKGLLFTYAWGKLTEGVDYKDDKLRTVVIVGIPYKMMDKKNESIKRAYDVLHNGGGFDHSSYVPMIRRVRQTKGRVVRTAMDYGACVFIDKRYSQPGILRGFPECERREIEKVEPGVVRERLEKFFRSVKV